MSKKIAIQGEGLRHALRLSLLSLSLTISLHFLLFSNIVSFPEAVIDDAPMELVTCPGDTIPPTAQCSIQILRFSFPVVINTYVDFIASRFDLASSDNCTASEDLLFSFSNDQHDTLRRAYCNNDVANNGLSYAIYVWDEAGNVDSCRVYLTSENCHPEPGNIKHISDANTLELQVQPTLTLECSDIDVCNSDSSSCSGMIQLRPQITSNCTPANGLHIQYKIDLDDDGNFDELGYSSNQGPVYPFPNPNNLPVRPFLANLPQADGTYPVGSHVIYWEVQDSCGMQAECQQRFVVKDCTPPTMVCDVGVLGIMPEFGVGPYLYVIEPSDFVYQSSDNCTASENLTFSFSEDITDQIDSLYCRIDVGGGFYDREIYIWDEAGNYSTCMVSIFFLGCYIPTPAPTITGQIHTEEGERVELPILATVYQGGGVVEEELIADGMINFHHLQPRFNTSLELYKDDHVKNGVTTFDLILISKHILDVEPLGSPYKIIAADVNRSGNITTFDMLEIRKLILGVNNEFRSNTSWRFVLEDYVFDNPQNPFQSPFPEVYLNTSLEGDHEVDFIAMKTGDVNNSVNLSLVEKPSDRSSAALPIYFEDQNLEAGKLYSIPLTLEEEARFYGMQFELGSNESDLELLGLESAQLDIGAEHFRIDDQGNLRFSWHQGRSMEGGALCNLQLRAKRGGRLSEILRMKAEHVLPEIYQEDESGTLLNYPLSLQFQKQATASNSSCEQDSIPPNIFCEIGTLTIPCWTENPCDPSAYGYHLYASDFVIDATDDCTDDEDLIFAFSDNPTDTFISHPTWDGGVRFSRDIHVWDEAGNVSVCNVVYVLNYCHGGEVAIVSGRVFTEKLEPISSFKSSMTSDGCNYYDTTTTGQFQYSIEALDHEFRIEKNDQHKNGISTFDLITISRHILGIDTLDSPYKRIAADVNRSSSVTGLDMLFLRRLILGIDTAFTKNTSWRFLKANYTFPNPEVPYNAPFAEPDTFVNEFFNYFIYEDYIGIKIGDVTGNADPSAFTHTETRHHIPPLYFTTPDQQLQAGHTYQLPIHAETDHRLLGFQFTLDLAPETLAITDIRSGQLETLNREHFGWQNQDQGQLTASWHEAEGLFLTDEPLFYLEVVCRQDGLLSEMINLHAETIAAEAYTQEEGQAIEVAPLALQFQTPQQSANTVTIYPNPTTDWLNIQSDLPLLEIELWSSNGQKMSHWPAQNNTHTIHVADLPPGLYLLRLLTTDKKITHFKLQKI